VRGVVLQRRAPIRGSLSHASVIGGTMITAYIDAAANLQADQLLLR
jgi:hypothetical protein